MARIIQHKRGNVADIPVLEVTEFGYTIDTKKLYLGDAAGNRQVCMRDDAVALIKVHSATGSNTVAITTEDPFGYTQGEVIKWKQELDSTGAVSLNINADGAIVLKDSDGNAVTDISADIVYEAYYDVTGACFFQLTKADGTAVAAQVLDGIPFSNKWKTNEIGTMPNNGTVNITPSTANQAIVLGYHDGNGLVYGDTNLVATKIQSGIVVFGVTGTYTNTLSAPTAAQVLISKVVYANGVEITGTMPDNAGDTVATSSSVDSTTLKLLAPVGFYDGIDDKVTITDAAFLAANIKHGISIFGKTGSYDTEAVLPISVATVLSGKIGYVNGVKITGTMPNNAGDVAAVSAHMDAGTVLHVVPATGYTDGSDDAVTIDLATVDADLAAANIKHNVALFGVTGSYDTEAVSPIEVATVLSGKIGYVNGVKITGTMPDNGTVSTDISAKATEVTIAAGKHSGSGVVKIAAAEQAKIIAGNIKNGIEILGVTGTHTDITAGANTFVEDAVGSYVSGSTTPDKVAHCDITITGKYRVSVYLYGGDGAHKVYYRPYVDGSPVGSEHSTTTNGTYTDDLTLIAGQDLQIYLWIDAGGYNAVAEDLALKINEAIMAWGAA